MSLTAERLRELLEYDPETGVFTWRVSRGRAIAGNEAGCVRPEGICRAYRFIKINSRHYQAHRLAWLHVHGEWVPEGMQIDHVNCDGLDNRIRNLRLATGSQNCANRRAPTSNTSGLKGVSWHTRDRKWRAYINVGGRIQSLGYFTDKNAAAQAYRAAALEHFGEFART